MATYERDGVSIHYEERGSGFPVLLIAPGGMRSTIGAWANAPWDPVEHLEPHFKVIVMDQRNAGQSRAPIRPTDGWQVYTEDQIALMDHLGVEEFHVAGMCIGGPYCMGLASAVPDRVTAAVLFQPIGLDDNRQAFFDMFDSWAEELKPGRDDVDPEAWEAFKRSMYGGDFLFNVSREFVAGCSTPLLVLCGRDLYHPESTSREIVALAPDAELIERWKEPENQEAARARVLEFLVGHTP